jgi:PAS domain S-box-containing protein
MAQLTAAQHPSYLHDHLALALAAGELGTWRWDRATGVTAWDPTMERLFGLEPGEFDGTFEGWVAMVHRDDVERALEVVERAVADRAPYELEHRVIWSDGSVHWLHGRGMVTVDDEDNVTGTIGCSADITARKQLEIDAERRVVEAERIAARERQHRQRLEFLDSLNDSAISATDHRGLMHNVASAAVPQLGDWCAVYFVPEGSAVPEIEVAHRDPAKVAWAEELLRQFPYDPDAPRGVPAVIRTGAIEFVPKLSAESVDRAIDRVADSTTAEQLRSIVGALQLTSLITVPMRTKRGIVGAIQFVSAESGRELDDDDVALGRTVAGRIGEALENAWLTDQQRTIAGTLQAALLPPRLPEIDGASVAVRYWAAGTATNVGGDFYDVFPVGEGCWAIVIGDVCGTGPNAAAVTAIARHTIRAAATHGAPHDEVLAWVNDALHAGNRDLFCTAIYSTLERIDSEAWRFVSVAGGHPLPIVVAADGSTSTIGRPGTLLGVLPQIRTTTTEVLLRPGDTLLFHTDGVTDVKPPYELDPEHFTRLAVEAAGSARTADEVATRLGLAIHRVLPIPDRHDDVALVVVHILQPFGSPTPAVENTTTTQTDR